MRIHKGMGAALALVMALAAVAPVAAQETTLAPCAGDQVSGTVVAVDSATGLVTIDTGTGECTVTLSSGGYTHPIVELLGQYFGSTSASSLEAALQDSATSLVLTDGTWGFAADGAPDALPATVLSVTTNVVGSETSYTIEFMVEGQTAPVSITTTDSALATKYMDALKSLTVDWNLQAGENGAVSVVTAGDEIAQYHEDGMGFGVLVKLFSMAADSLEACTSTGATAPAAGSDGTVSTTCGVSVQQLVDEFKSGTGLGKLFQEYGKPAIMGVGQVRQAESQTDQSNPDKAASGRCKVKTQGRGRGRGHAPTIVCPQVTPGAPGATEAPESGD